MGKPVSTRRRPRFYSKFVDARSKRGTRLEGLAPETPGALLRVLEDGRLQLDNNRSERELRSVAVGRKAWLFVGSDDHGAAAGHLFSMIASARLQGSTPSSTCATSSACSCSGRGR